MHLARHADDNIHASHQHVIVRLDRGILYSLEMRQVCLCERRVSVRAKSVSAVMQFLTSLVTNIANQM